MRLRAHPGSNVVYADTAGNILYIWNAAIPVRPHPAGGDHAVPAARTDEVWTDLHDLEALPQLLNPRGGYVRNENDAPWLTNLRQPLVPADFPVYFEPDGPLSLRSQHSALLIDSDTRFSLEDVVRLKHSDRMLLADRVKDDLVAAVRAALRNGTFEDDDRVTIANAVAVIESWNNTAAAGSRGAVLFAEWWDSIPALLREIRSPNRGGLTRRSARRRAWLTPISRAPALPRRYARPPLVSEPGTWPGATYIASGAAPWTNQPAAVPARSGAFVC